MLINDDKKGEVAEALHDVSGSVYSGFSEVAGRIAKFERATVSEMIGEMSGAIDRVADGLGAIEGLAVKIGDAGQAIADAIPSDLSSDFSELRDAICDDDDKRSLADAVYMLGDKIADGLKDLAEAVRATTLVK
jgi:hypothetical protein